MEILISKGARNLTYWKTANGKFFGVIIAPFQMWSEGQPQEIKDMPAGALLAVPRSHEAEIPSIHKYSPLIAQAPTLEEIGPLLERWTDQHAGEPLWNLRLR